MLNLLFCITCTASLKCTYRQCYVHEMMPLQQPLAQALTACLTSDSFRKYYVTVAESGAIPCSETLLMTCSTPKSPSGTAPRSSTQWWRRNCQQYSTCISSLFLLFYHYPTLLAKDFSKYQAYSVEEIIGPLVFWRMCAQRLTHAFDNSTESTGFSYIQCEHWKGVLNVHFVNPKDDAAATNSKIGKCECINQGCFWGMVKFKQQIKLRCRKCKLRCLLRCRKWKLW